MKQSSKYGACDAEKNELEVDGFVMNVWPVKSNRNLKKGILIRTRYVRKIKKEVCSLKDSSSRI